MLERHTFNDYADHPIEETVYVTESPDVAIDLGVMLRNCSIPFNMSCLFSLFVFHIRCDNELDMAILDDWFGDHYV